MLGGVIPGDIAAKIGLVSISKEVERETDDYLEGLFNNGMFGEKIGDNS